MADNITSVGHERWMRMCGRQADIRRPVAGLR